MLDSVKLHALSISDESTQRDWGQSIIIKAESRNDETVFYREKFLIFKPGASIILESHSDYDEIWIPNNTLTYIKETDNELVEYVAKEHERIFIPRGIKHKIINDNTHELCIFEIQVGKIDPTDKQQYIDEDLAL